jgi:hypothetical protein
VCIPRSAAGGARKSIITKVSLHVYAHRGWHQASRREEGVRSSKEREGRHAVDVEEEAVELGWERRPGTNTLGSWGVTVRGERGRPRRRRRREEGSAAAG